MEGRVTELLRTGLVGWLFSVWDADSLEGRVFETDLTAVLPLVDVNDTGLSLAGGAVEDNGLSLATAEGYKGVSGGVRSQS